MNLDRVAITGADENVRSEDLVNLSDKITDNDLACFSVLIDFWRLYLHGSKGVAETVLKRLSELPSLERLDLRNCYLYFDFDNVLISGFHHLKYWYLSENDTGRIEKLWIMLPSCKIHDRSDTQVVQAAKDDDWKEVKPLVEQNEEWVDAFDDCEISCYGIDRRIFHHNYGMKPSKGIAVWIDADAHWPHGGNDGRGEHVTENYRTDMTGWSNRNI